MKGFKRTVNGLKVSFSDKEDREFLSHIIAVFGYLISFPEMGKLISFEEMRKRIIANYGFGNNKVNSVLDFLESKNSKGE